MAQLKHFTDVDLQHSLLASMAVAGGDCRAGPCYHDVRWWVDKDLASDLIPVALAQTRYLIVVAAGGFVGCNNHPGDFFRVFGVKGKCIRTANDNHVAH